MNQHAAHQRIEKNAAYKLSRETMNHRRQERQYSDEQRQGGEGKHYTKKHPHKKEHARQVDATFKMAHVVQLAGILTPVIVGHFIKKPENQWRAVRIASLVTAVLTGGLWEAHHYRREHENKDKWVDRIDRVCDELSKEGVGQAL